MNGAYVVKAYEAGVAYVQMLKKYTVKKIFSVADETRWQLSFIKYDVDKWHFVSVYLHPVEPFVS